VETTQNAASSPPSQISRGRSLGQGAVAWFCAAMALVLGWLATTGLRPRRRLEPVPDFTFDPAFGGLVRTGSHLAEVQHSARGIASVLPSLIALLVIPLVRRQPIAAMAVLTLGTIGVGTVNAPADARYFYFTAVVAFVWYVAAKRPRRTSVPSALIVLAGMTAGLAIQPPGDSRLLLTHVFVVSLMTAVAWLIGDSFRTRRENAVRLRAETSAAAVTTERLRIARELHDMIAHSIGIIAIQAGVGSRVIDTQPAEARKALQAIEETSRETLSGLRRTLTALRHNDTSTVPTEPAPGLADLDKLVATTRHAGVRVDLTRRGMPRPLPPDIDLAAYRIIQESVTNVVRHSGTHSCRVIVAYADDELTVETLDDGHGTFGSPGSGFGLVGMRERVSLLHGDFDAGLRPGGGFRVSARLPIPGFTTTFRTVKKSAELAGVPAVSGSEERADAVIVTDASSSAAVNIASGDSAADNTASNNTAAVNTPETAAAR
jgi:signal transduction histidine kinase